MSSGSLHLNYEILQTFTTRSLESGEFLAYFLEPNRPAATEWARLMKSYALTTRP